MIAKQASYQCGRIRIVSKAMITTRFGKNPIAHNNAKIEVSRQSSGSGRSIQHSTKRGHRLPDLLVGVRGVCRQWYVGTFEIHCLIIIHDGLRARERRKAASSGVDTVHNQMLC